MFRLVKTHALFRLAACLFVLVSFVSAEEILFIGNSFTHGNDPRLSKHGGVPAVFEAICQAKGKNVNATMMAVSARDWRFHLRNKKTLQVVGSQTWDIVVLQDYSTRPTHIGDRKGFLKDGRDFCELIWKHSPNAKIALYRTWAREPGNALYSTPEKKSRFRDFDEMDSEIGESYGDLFRKLRAANRKKTILLAPVGDAVARCVKEFPEIPTYASDAYHLDVKGSYLAALVFYKTLFNESPLGAIHEFGTFSVEEGTAGILQKVATEVRPDK